MQEPTGKSEILELIQKERKHLETTLAQVTENQMLQPGAQDGWTVKDILAHITTWEQRMVRWLEETLQGDVPQMLPPGMTWDDLDQWNEQTYLENRERPLAEVLAKFHQSYQQALKAAEAASEEDLMDPQRFAWREGRPLWIMVAANTYWHYEEHNQAIRTWLEQPTTS